MVTARGRVALAARGRGAVGVAGHRSRRGRDDRRTGRDDAGQVDPAPAAAGPPRRRRDRHERQVDDHPDDRRGAGHPGSGRHQRRGREHGRRAGGRAGGGPRRRRWPRSRSTRCTSRTSWMQWTPRVIILLNLSRDQLDRVGEINHIERTLRGGLARHPDAVVVANCDDVLMTSAAYDSPHVVWVAAGGGWAGDSVSCPRSGEIIVRDADALVLDRYRFQAARPAVVVRRHPPSRTRRAVAADDAGAAGRGQPRQRHPGRRRGGHAWAPTPPPRWRRCRWWTRSPAATGPCSSVRTPRECCWRRIRQAGRRRCRWWTRTARAW